MKIIITGGAGYIGSHTAVEAIRAGHEVIIIDDFSNSSKDSIHRIKMASGKRPIFYEVSLLNSPVDIYDVIGEHAHDADALIHFAAFKSAPESVENPVSYYRNNIDTLFTSIRLCEILSIENFIFSSSATVYGEPQFLPITESHPINRGNTPYGTSKVMGEWILEDSTKKKRIKSVALRYFNPAGADHTGLIGEMPSGRPGNLVPIITQAAAGFYGETIKVTGTDFPTPDGSAIRDYIHVSDLAHAHLASLEWLSKQTMHTFDVFNIGTGRGTSVYEMIDTFVMKVEPDMIVCEKAERRSGDAAEVWCDPEKAKRILGWEAKLGVLDILKSAWDWEQRVRKIFAYSEENNTM
jgi:UDP-glucose 4-epimerase